MKQLDLMSIVAKHEAEGSLKFSGPAGFTHDFRLPYVYREPDGTLFSFQQPILSAEEGCILVQRLLYCNNPDRPGKLMVEWSSHYFDWPSQSISLGGPMPRKLKEGPDALFPHSPDYVARNAPMWFKVEASVDNLRKFIDLPYTLEEHRFEAMKLIHLWDVLIPEVTQYALRMKVTTELITEPLPGEKPEDTVKRAPHRRPMWVSSEWKYVTETKTRMVTRARSVTEHLTTVTERSMSSEEQIKVAYGLLQKEDLKLTSEEKYSYLRFVPEKVPERYERTEFKNVMTSKVHESNDLQAYSPYNLYSQQLIGAWSIIQAKRYPLWFDMRVGKTASALTALCYLLDKGLVECGIVICPSPNVFDPWVHEAQAHGLDIMVLDAVSDLDEEALLNWQDYDLFILNYERLAIRLDLICEILPLHKMMGILDETSYIANPESGRTQACWELCRHLEYVTLLNGTPIGNSVADLWAQMKCLDYYGVVWGWTFSDFCARWLRRTHDNKWQAQNQFELEMFIAQTSLRYLRAEADQYSGVDKTYRYVWLAPTEQQEQQTLAVLEGLLETVDSDGNTVTQDTEGNFLRVMSFLREIACGYDKYREDEYSPYQRVRHPIDPKLLWVRAFLEGNSAPLVIFTEFTEQEQRLKEMLNEMGIKWSSKSGLGNWVRRARILQEITVGMLRAIELKFSDICLIRGTPFVPSWARPQDLIRVPGWLRHDDEIKDFVRENYGYQWIEKYQVLEHPKSYPGRVFTHELKKFQEGEVHVFICKWSQAFGFSLNRKPAVAKGIGAYPYIVSLAPPWSVVNWKQGSDRCVGTDKMTGANLTTPIYNLVIKGTLEEKVMAALRRKETVSSTLLRDATKSGYKNFAENLISSLRAARHSSDLFDATEMQSRIELGVPPYSKLTEKLIKNKTFQKLGKKLGIKKKDVPLLLPEAKKVAYDYLISKA